MELRHPALLHLISIALLGLATVWVDREQPLVRNSLVYARASRHVIAHAYNPAPVVADSRLSYDKPIGFAWLAAPLVKALGAHAGLVASSFAGTIAYLLAAWYFATSFRWIAVSCLRSFGVARRAEMSRVLEGRSTKATTSSRCRVESLRRS